MADKRRKDESILQQLKDGTARFELVSSPVRTISSVTFPKLPFSDGGLPFARIASALGRDSAALKKVERFSVQKVTGDGRCLFRALKKSWRRVMLNAARRFYPILKCYEVKGMAFHKGIALNAREERQDADELRMAVKEVMCDSNEERQQYEEALIAITVDEPLKRYCKRIESPDFWGGESELLVISKLCRQPIVVYIPEHEHSSGGWGSGFIPIAEYGLEFCKGSRNKKKKDAVRLLYSGRNHYDLLV